MSNQEHLIENAFVGILRGKTYEQWYEEERGSVYGNAGGENSKYFSDRDLEIIWECAYYMKYTWCDGWNRYTGCEDCYNKDFLPKKEEE